MGMVKAETETERSEGCKGYLILIDITFLVETRWKSSLDLSIHTVSFTIQKTGVLSTVAQWSLRYLLYNYIVLPMS